MASMIFIKGTQCLICTTGFSKFIITKKKLCFVETFKLVRKSEIKMPKFANLFTYTSMELKFPVIFYKGLYSDAILNLTDGTVQVIDHEGEMINKYILTISGARRYTVFTVRVDDTNPIFGDIFRYFGEPEIESYPNVDYEVIEYNGFDSFARINMANGTVKIIDNDLGKLAHEFTLTKD